MKDDTGHVIERVGMRGPFTAAVFLAALTTAAYGLQAGFVVFLIARMLWGVCWSFLRLGGYMTALGHASDHRRGYYLGFYNGVGRIGTLVSVLIGGFLTDTIGFQATIWLFGGLTLFGAVAIAREKMEVAGQKSASMSDVDTDSQPFVADPRLWAVYAATFINGVAGGGLVVSTIGLWLLEQYGASIQIVGMMVGVATLSGALLSARYLVEAVWGPAAGHLSDRFNRIGFILMTGAVVVCAMVGLSFRPAFLGALGLAAGVFFAGTALHVALDASAGRLTTPQNRARVMSWYANWSDLGNAVGPFLAYQVVAIVGLDWVYRGGAAFLTVAGATALWFMREREANGQIGKSANATEL